MRGNRETEGPASSPFRLETWYSEQNQWQPKKEKGIQNVLVITLL